jgi:hypothetical protein
VKEWPEFGRRRSSGRPARVQHSGSISALLRRREAVEDARPVAELLVAAASSSRAPCRQIDDDGAPAGGGTRARAQCRARRGGG